MRTDLSPESRVWIYQADRQLNDGEIAIINERLKNFCVSWTAHNMALKADFDILHGRFIVLAVDETQTDASGCSIDKSVRELKELSAQLNVDLFNRMNLSYLSDGMVKTINMNEIPEAFKNREINEDTIFFNTLANTLETLNSTFRLPLKSHWANRLIA